MVRILACLGVGLRVALCTLGAYRFMFCLTAPLISGRFFIAALACEARFFRYW